MARERANLTVCTDSGESHLRMKQARRETALYEPLSLLILFLHGKMLSVQHVESG